jgi:Ca2+-transporting ATPase
MRRKPRKRDESLFAGGLAWGIVLLGILMAVCSLALFWWRLPSSDTGPLTDRQLEYPRTMMFVALALFQLFHVLAIRSATVSLFRQGLWSNYRLAIAVLVGGALQIAIIYIAPLQAFIHTVPLSLSDLAICVATASLVFWVLEAWKPFRGRFVHD